MARIYSASFFQAPELEGTNTLTVPAGHIWVLRCIDVYWGSQVVAPIGRIQGNAGQTFANWGGLPLTPDEYSWRGRMVLDPLQHVYIVVDSGNADVSISGWDLLIP